MIVQIVINIVVIGDQREKEKGWRVLMSQVLTMLGKFGSPDDTDSSGHLLSPSALNNDTWVVHVEQISPILVEKQDRIQLIC